MSLAKAPQQERPTLSGLTTVVLVVFSFVFFIGGFVLFAYAPEVIGVEILMFSAGILSIAISLFIPMSLIRYIDGA